MINRISGAKTVMWFFAKSNRKVKVKYVRWRVRSMWRKFSSCGSVCNGTGDAQVS